MSEEAASFKGLDAEGGLNERRYFIAIQLPTWAQLIVKKTNLVDVKSFIIRTISNW